MGRVFKSMITLFNYGYLYEYSLVNTLFNYECSIQIYDYTNQLWIQYSFMKTLIIKDYVFIYEYAIQL